MPKTYPAKVSYGFLVIIFLLFYGPLVPALMKYGFDLSIGVAIGLLTLIFAFVLHLFLKTEYIIDGKYLKIKHGIFSFKPIDIETIKEVSNTKTLISSPAPSFDRIAIKYGKFSEIIISPRDKKAFVNDLLKINPTIKHSVS